MLRFVRPLLLGLALLLTWGLAPAQAQSDKYTFVAYGDTRSQPDVHRRIIAEIAPYAVVVDPKTQNLQEVVQDLTEEGVGVDVALECVGLEASLNACADSVRRQGKVVQVGLHIKRASIDAMQWALKDLTLEATWCYPVQVWPRIARLIASGAFPVEKVITARIDAADVVAKGFEALLDPAGHHLKIVVRT